MVRSVADAAVILSIIAGRDSRDNYTSAAPAEVPDYTRALDTEALRGARIGIPRRYIAAQLDDVQVSAFNASLATLRERGATIVDPADFPAWEELLESTNDTVVLKADFKVSP